jgi:hypothetical protein
MKVSEFINRCVSEGCAWSKGKSDTGEPGYFIKHMKFNTITHFTPQAVLANEFGQLWPCIVQGKDVVHMSRVCGYFSRINNWNKSKQGELKDRQKGSYVV